MNSVVEFERPGLLVLFGVVWVILAWLALRARRIAFNGTDHPHWLCWTFRRATAWLPNLLRGIALALIVCCIARPLDRLGIRQADARGIAIEVVIDRSGSMRRDDYRLDGKPVRRLDAVVRAASHFIAGESERGGRSSDLIGLIAFARFADRLCPPTLDHEQSIAELQRIEAAADYREDGTALGDGLSLAVADLAQLQAHLAAGDGEPLSRVVVLLTDGQHNAGQIDPELARQLAVRSGVRVHVIGLNPAAGRSPTARQRLVDSRRQLVDIAASTGGRFFAVDDSEGLQRVYAEIDAMERRYVGRIPVAVHRHWAVNRFVFAGLPLPSLLSVAFWLLVVEFCLRRIVYLQPWETLR
jgi:Ca-activated chloride channel family protein